MKFIQITFLCFLLIISANGQNRSYAVHKRGMLHQTVFNTGELGRTYDGGTAGVQQGVPSFEWPGNSSVIVDSKQYSGQHNSFGGGMYIGTSRRDTSARLTAYCGAVTGLPVAGSSSFPISIVRSENYPVLANGNLNPIFDPNEAEEKIISKWGTSVGITVTRTSRAWSLPDYDDFIIYEYELENSGDVDGNPITPNRQDTLREVLVAFAYGLAPGMFGYERKYNRWNGDDYQAKDVYARFDRRRWLSYAIDRDGKPEIKYFNDWAMNQKYGGGLLTPQAVGYMPLYYDTTHLAYRTETNITLTSNEQNVVWDINNHLKQPYLNRLETTSLTKAKIDRNFDISQSRPSANVAYTNALFGPDWIGRSAFNVRQSQYFGTGKMVAFGPYIMKPGEKIRFAIAEVAGYGAASAAETQSGLMDEGGSCGQLCGDSPSLNAFNPVPNWTDTIRYGVAPALHGSTYLRNYPLPQYVNSKVVTMRDVADRAIQLYTGRTLIDYDSTQFWPENSPSTGVYQAPMIIPAPMITIPTDSLPRNSIIWENAIEQFTSPNLVAPFSHYIVERSPERIGPWQRLDSVGIADPRYFIGGKYVVNDINVRIGEQFYYSVISVDNQGNKSGRTNVLHHETQQVSGNIGNSLSEIRVVPNPFIVRSGFGGGNNADNRIGFFNLPPKCSIRIISYSGQLVETIQHESGFYSTAYYQVSRNNQVLASGLYFFVVETPDGKRTHGKFVVIH